MASNEYNQNYYMEKRDRLKDELVERHRTSTRCLDGHSVSFIDQEAFKSMCQSRRNMQGSTRTLFSSYCNECNLHDKVDAGFLPDNIGLIN